MSPVLVTGGSGYVGTQLIAALLRDGTAVRATVRSADSGAGLRKAVRRGGADEAGLEVVVADLLADGGWSGAVAGCGDIYHVASPMIQPKDPDEVIVPAREGTLRVLRAARDAGAGAFLAAPDQGDAGRDDDRRAAPALRRRGRARRG